MILFKFAIVLKSSAAKLSLGLCHTSGNGDGIKCNIGTPKFEEDELIPKTFINQLNYYPSEGMECGRPQYQHVRTDD